MSWLSKRLKPSKKLKKKLKKLKFKDVLGGVGKMALASTPLGGLVSTVGKVADFIPDEVRQIKGSDIVADMIKGKSASDSALDQIETDNKIIKALQSNERQSSARPRGQIVISSSRSSSSKGKVGKGK